MVRYSSQENEPVPDLIWWLIGITLAFSGTLLLYVGYALLAG